MTKSVPGIKVAGINPAALICWLSIQLFPLGVAALRIPLWARNNGLIEDWALILLFAAQLSCSALLFPWLLSSKWQSAATLLAAWPFVLLAGLLARSSIADVLWYAANISIWLTALGLWRVVFSTTKSALMSVTVSSSFVFGGLTVIYLMMEFADTAVSLVQITKWLPITFVCNLACAISAATLIPKLRAKLSTGSC